MKFRYNKVDEFLESLSSNDSVFHYTRKSTAIEKILYNDLFKLSSLNNTNDPNEYSNKMIGASGWGWTKETSSKLNETTTILDRLLERYTSFISCCSNDYNQGSLNNHGCLKSRMWSQYGENHEGICLVFSKTKLIKLIKEKCDGNTHLVCEGDINYLEYVNDDSRHNSISIDSDTFDTLTPEDVAINHIKKYQREFFLRKQRDYKDEQEFRIVVLQASKLDSLNSVPEFKVSNCLVGIILGDRFPDVYLPSVMEIANKFNYQYRRLHWASGEYFLLSGTSG